jgi:hypothetical protein
VQIWFAFYSGVVIAIAGLMLTSLQFRPLMDSLLPVPGVMGILCAVGTRSIDFAVNRTSAKSVSQYHCTQLLVGSRAPTWSGTTGRACPCWPLDR